MEANGNAPPGTSSCRCPVQIRAGWRQTKHEHDRMGSPTASPLFRAPSGGSSDHSQGSASALGQRVTESHPHGAKAPQNPIAQGPPPRPARPSPSHGGVTAPGLSLIIGSPPCPPPSTADARAPRNPRPARLASTSPRACDHVRMAPSSGYAARRPAFEFAAHISLSLCLTVHLCSHHLTS